MPKKNRFEGLTCYTCEAPACGDEHAPPESIYPRSKRQNLIMVPSCAKHNNEKRLEDELIKATVVLSNDNSPDGMEVLESVIRAMEYNPHLAKTFMPFLEEKRVCGINTGVFRINRKRFDRSISYIVRALWFCDRGEKLHAKLDVNWIRLRKPDLSPHPEFQNNLQLATYWPESDYRGVYPEVFRYDFHEVPSKRKIGYGFCRLLFYDGPPVVVTWEIKRPNAKR